MVLLLWLIHGANYFILVISFKKFPTIFFQRTKLQQSSGLVFVCLFSVLSASWPELSTDAEYFVAFQEGYVSSANSLDVQAQQYFIHIPVTLQAWSTIQFLMTIKKKSVLQGTQQIFYTCTTRIWLLKKKITDTTISLHFCLKISSYL